MKIVNWCLEPGLAALILSVTDQTSKLIVRETFNPESKISPCLVSFIPVFYFMVQGIETKFHEQVKIIGEGEQLHLQPHQLPKSHFT